VLGFNFKLGFTLNWLVQENPIFFLAGDNVSNFLREVNTSKSKVRESKVTSPHS